MQLTLVIDSHAATRADYLRAAATLAAFGGEPATLSLDAVTLTGPAEAIARAASGAVTQDDETPDAASVGFGNAAPTGDSVDALIARVEKDADGLPHDARIHASTRVKNADGRWKKKRGVEDATVARVEAELRHILGVPGPAEAPSAPVVAHDAGVSMTVIAPPPPPEAAPQAAPVAAVTSFAQLMAFVGPALSSGKLTPTSVELAMRGLGIVDGSGVGQLALLAARPDLVPAAHTALSQLAGG